MVKLLLAVMFLFATHAALADVTGSARVVDGDTLWIGETKTRLDGIDAPEAKQRCQDSHRVDYRCGAFATHWLRQMVKGREVRCEGDKRDRYGRLIVVCHVGGTNLNARMVRDGWAVAYRRYSTEYVRKEDDARNAGRGMWAGEFQMPWDWRKGQRSSGTSDGDKDCKDFKTWVEAQAFFKATGPGEPHRLDRDKDGIACESLR